MTPQNIAKPESISLSTSLYTQITNHKYQHKRSPTDYKKQDFNTSKIQNQNAITPSKKPKWHETTSTQYTAEKITNKKQKELLMDEQEVKDEIEYIQHLRNILKHLENTSLILESNRKQNKEIYQQNIKRMVDTKNQLKLKQLLLQEQFQELRLILRQKQQNK